MKKWISEKRGLLSLCAVAAVAFGLSGCVSNPTSSALSVGQTSLYFGTSNWSGLNNISFASGGVWSITLDPVTGFFSYNDVNRQPPVITGNTPFSGTLTTTPSGFLDLALSQGTTSGGYAVNLPGEGLLMRTNSSTTDIYGNSPSTLIAATISAACPAFTSAQTFNFVAQGTTVQGDPIVHVAYGSVQISPGSAATWSFSSLTMNDLSGNALSPSPIPNATCPPTQEGFVLVSPLTNSPYTPAQITTGISPSGLLVIDPGQNEDAFGHLTVDITPTGPTGLMGVLKPSAALNVSDMVGQKYAGFESDPLSPLGTIAVAFGSTPGTGTAITGGGFPGDDVTQQPRADTTLDLGTQSTQTPGLFPSVTLTQPDTYDVCAGTPSAGTDSSGNPTCIYHGVAVAGQVNGKYVIFTNINDPTALNPTGATPLAVINLALYQQ